MGTNLKYAIKSWVNASAAWRWRAIVFTGRYPEAPDALWTLLAKQEEALHYEADALATALEEHAKVSRGRRAKILVGVAGLIRKDQADLDASTVISPRAFNRPTTGPGMGGLKGWWTSPMTWTEVGNAFKKILIALGIIGGIGAGVTGAVIGYRAFLRTEAEKARDDIEGARVIQASRAADLAKCATDPDPEACRDQVNELYDSLMPGGCSDVLDTPLGSTLGLLAGAGLGYVGMRKIMGWT